jgi:hypothetical protein
MPPGSVTVTQFKSLIYKTSFLILFVEFAPAKCGWWLAPYSHAEPHTTYWAMCIATNVTATVIKVWADTCSGQLCVTKGIFYMPRQHKASIGRTYGNNNE